VLEHRVASRLERDGAGWLPRAYCRTKGGLISALSRLNLAADPSPLAHLPERFDGFAPASRRPFLTRWVTASSFDEIITGIAKAREAGLTLVQIRHALERCRRETVRLLGSVGLQDAQSGADLQRLSNLCGGGGRR
jgi:hypothetical protein